MDDPITIAAGLSAAQRRAVCALTPFGNYVRSGDGLMYMAFWVGAHRIWPKTFNPLVEAGCAWSNDHHGVTAGLTPLGLLVRQALKDLGDG